MSESFLDRFGLSAVFNAIANFGHSITHMHESFTVRSGLRQPFSTIAFLFVFISFISFAVYIIYTLSNAIHFATTTKTQDPQEPHQPPIVATVPVEPPPPIKVTCTFPDDLFPVGDTMATCLDSAGCDGAEQICRQIAKAKGVSLASTASCVDVVARRLDAYEISRVSGAMASTCPTYAYRFLGADRSRQGEADRRSFLERECLGNPRLIAGLKRDGIGDLPFDDCSKKN